jgi:hypothetical protein
MSCSWVSAYTCHSCLQPIVRGALDQAPAASGSPQLSFGTYTIFWSLFNNCMLAVPLTAGNSSLVPTPALTRYPALQHQQAGQGQQVRGMFIQTQPTPNPQSLMFVPGKQVLEVSEPVQNVPSHPCSCAIP